MIDYVDLYDILQFHPNKFIYNFLVGTFVIISKSPLVDGVSNFQDSSRTVFQRSRTRAWIIVSGIHDAPCLEPYQTRLQRIIYLKMVGGVAGERLPSLSALAPLRQV